MRSGGGGASRRTSLKQKRRNHRKQNSLRPPTRTHKNRTKTSEHKKGHAVPLFSSAKFYTANTRQGIISFLSASNRAQRNSCNIAAPSAPAHPQTRAPNGRRNEHNAPRYGPSRNSSLCVLRPYPHQRAGRNLANLFLNRILSRNQTTVPHSKRSGTFPHLWSSSTCQ